MSVMATARDAWALASADQHAGERLWEDPVAFGAGMGLQGAELAELIGGVRYGLRGREASAADQELLYAAINVENGWGSWPFSQAADSEWPRFIALTEHHTSAVISGAFYGVEPDPATKRYRMTWAVALRDEAIRRAEANTEVSMAVADALIAARGLLAVCEKA
jgi:hypothetical protein